MPITWTVVAETGIAGTGPGGPPTNVPVPPAVIDGETHVLRNNDLWEIDVSFHVPGLTKANWAGAAIYIEDPDISGPKTTRAPTRQGPVPPILNGSTPLDGSANLQGAWAPLFINDATTSPVAVMVPTDVVLRSVRIYVCSFGPNQAPNLVRANGVISTTLTAAITSGSQTATPQWMSGIAVGTVLTVDTGVNLEQVTVTAVTDTTFTATFTLAHNSGAPIVGNSAATPTPSISVQLLPQATAYVSGMEVAWLVTNVAVTVNPEYNKVPPLYTLTYQYQPPSPEEEAHRPPGIGPFGGVAIWYQYTNPDGSVTLKESGEYKYVATASPAGNQLVTWTSTEYQANKGSFGVYFVSADINGHQNSIVPGVTPFVTVSIDPTVLPPSVSGFTIDPPTYQWQLDGSFEEIAVAHWSLPTSDPNGKLYAGVYLYLVAVQGTTPPLTPVPKMLAGQLANVDASYPIDISPIPTNPEQWTIAAISVDFNGVLADDPANLSHSPTATVWAQAPTPGSPGSTTQYSPLITITAGAMVAATSSVSGDGVGMVSFAITGPGGTGPAWTEPSSNQFGGAQVAMVINSNPASAVYWPVPKGQTSFTTPAMASFGNIGATVPVDFYIVSDDPQGHKNPLVLTGGSPTPSIHFSYVPTEGAVIPARSGWFDNEFTWPAGGSFAADSFAAGKILVGSQLIVGGAPSSFSGSSKFDGQNGQIAVLNSTGVLRAWMGESLPGKGTGQGTQPGVYGGWFGAIYIGGTNPLDAPIFIDSQGIVQVGGIAAAPNTSYPYISVRDASGYEKGRIGAKLTMNSNSAQDGVGTSPPSGLTSGAWFTQLAVGGTDLSHWNVLIVPDSNPNNPLGSTFSMRGISTLTIDYAASASVFENHYQLLMGQTVWSGVGSSSWKFPGIQIFEVDGAQNAFGITMLNRGIVLRGTNQQGYPVLGSFDMFNGTQSGSDVPQAAFYCELAMYSPNSPNNRTVYLASGGSAPNTSSSLFQLGNGAGGINFQVDTSGNTFVAGMLQGWSSSGGGIPVNVAALNVNGLPVIDSSGNWVSGGSGIGGGGAGQSPWVGPIDAANNDLNRVHNITSYHTTYVLTDNAGGITPGLGIYNGNGIIVGGAGNTLPALNMQSSTLKMIDGGNINRMYLDNTGAIQTKNASGNALFYADANGSVGFSWQMYHGSSYNVLLIDQTGAWVGPLSPTNITSRNGNLVFSASGSPGSGTGWIVGDHISAVQDLGGATLNVGGGQVINQFGTFVGPAPGRSPDGVNTAGNITTVGWFYGHDINVSGTATFNQMTVANVTVNGTISLTTLTTTGLVTVGGLNQYPSTPLIDNFSNFVGKGIIIRGGNAVISVGGNAGTGSGWIVGDHIASVNEIGAAYVQVGGSTVIDTLKRWTGQDVIVNGMNMLNSSGVIYGNSLMIGGYTAIDANRNYQNVNQIQMGLSNYQFVDSARNVTCNSLNLSSGNIQGVNALYCNDVWSGGVHCIQNGGVWIGSISLPGSSSLTLYNLTATNALMVGNGAQVYVAGDLAVSRNSSPTTGAVYFGGGNNFLFFNGSQFQTNWPFNPTRLLVGGSAYAYSDGDAGFARTSSPTTGAIYFGNSGGQYIYYDATQFQFTSNIYTPSINCTGGINCHYLQLNGANIDGVGTLTAGAVQLNGGTLNAGPVNAGAITGSSLQLNGGAAYVGSINGSGWGANSSGATFSFVTATNGVNVGQYGSYQVNGAQVIDYTGKFVGSGGISTSASCTLGPITVNNGGIAVSQYVGAAGFQTGGQTSYQGTHSVVVRDVTNSYNWTITFTNGILTGATVGP